MSLRGEGVGIFLCLNSLPNKCLPKFDRRFQLCRQPPLRGCCSAVQCSVRIVSQLRPALENFLVGYYAHQTQMCSTIDLVDVSTAFDDYILLQKTLTADFGDVTIAFDD